MSWRVHLVGLEAAQRANQDLLAAVKSSGQAEGVKRAALEGQRYLMTITHVDTGTLRASSRVRMEGTSRNASARIFVDEGAVNWRTGAFPSDYVLEEELRGGSHAAWSRTVDEHFREMGDAFWTAFRGRLR